VVTSHKLVVEKSAGAVVFHRAESVEYLLIRSTYWEFPKGMIDASESETAAAIREVREETGMDVNLIDSFRETIQYFYRHKQDGALVKKQVIYFLGEAGSRAVKISWEHQEARWVSFQEALELVKYENARAILQKANEYVTAHL
jgi:bis(5'-nucleosidyl)-tetraphosphatase